MALAGIAYSCMVVSSFSRAQSRVLQLGYADDTNTHTMISGMIIQLFFCFTCLQYSRFIIGLWLSAFSLGNFVGPTIAGCLVQTEGFRVTTLVFFGLYSLMILIDIGEHIHTLRRNRIRDQYETL